MEHNQGILIAHDSIHLQYLVLELWKELCIRNYPLVTEQYPEEDCEEPESWREAYFVRRLFAILNYKYPELKPIRNYSTSEKKRRDGWKRLQIGYEFSD